MPDNFTHQEKSIAQLLYIIVYIHDLRYLVLGVFR